MQCISEAAGITKCEEPLRSKGEAKAKQRRILSAAKNVGELFMLYF